MNGSGRNGGVLIAAIAVALTIGGCGRQSRQVQNEAAWIVRGADIVAPFKADLKAALTKGLERGPEEAIATCQVQAPMIASRIGDEGVEVGRTSHKLRNPSNKPKAWMQPLLDAYEHDPADAKPHVVSLANDRVGYVEPIFVQPMCLTCHGTNIPDGLAAAIDKWYPNDEGRGFADGDFRGMFWAEFPAAETANPPEAARRSRSTM